MWFYEFLWSCKEDFWGEKKNTNLILLPIREFE